MTESERFWAKVDTTGECWLWTASTSRRHGYGKFSVGGKYGGWMNAHRWVYEHFFGPVPARLDLHHTCGVKRCVRLEHLKPVSRRDHMAVDGRLLSLRAHCAHGHAFDASNTHITVEGYRKCRTCHRQREALRRAVARAAHNKSIKRRGE
jgi:hypothetical protein